MVNFHPILVTIIVLGWHIIFGNRQSCPWADNVNANSPLPRLYL